jgi:hypothetical protein
MRPTRILLIVLISVAAARADLIVKVDKPKTVGAKSIVKMTMKNTFKEKIASARAEVFLIDEGGKMVGQAAKWVIGGNKEARTLAPDAETTFNFVVETDKPFKTAKVTFSRLVLEGGKLGDPQKDIQIQSVQLP